MDKSLKAKLKSIKPKQTFAEQIEKYLIKKDCWIWTGAFQQPANQPVVNFKGKTRYVHQLLFEERYGKRDKTLAILRNCSTINCLNPDHLFEGKPKGNKLDITIGTKFGKWTVIQEDRTDRFSYLCRCECGLELKIPTNTLTGGYSTSCIKCAGKSKRKDFCKNGHPSCLFIKFDGKNWRNGCLQCDRERHLFNKYGITWKEYIQLLDSQNWCCSICGSILKIDDANMVLLGRDPSVGIKADVDHDHNKGLNKKESIRGMLCGAFKQGCNYKLGNIDKGIWLVRAAEYINNPPAAKLFCKTNEDKINKME